MEDMHEMSPLLHNDNEDILVQKADSRKSSKVHPTAWTMKENEDNKVLIHTSRSTSQVWPDCILLILHYLQVYCIIQSMSLRWQWPLKYVTNLHYVFLANFDVWDFLKLQQNGTYVSTTEIDIPSDEIMVNYDYLLVIWGAILLVSLVIFLAVVIYIYLSNRLAKATLFAYLRWTYVWILRVITIPVGIVVARVFHCNDNDRVDILNDLKCYESVHWIYIAAALLLFVLLLMYLVWLFLKPHSQLMKMSADRHEGYLQLKEAEYLYGLDPMWAVTNFFLFVSYRKQGAYFKACLNLLDILLIFAYSFLFNYTTAQSLLTTGLLLVTALGVIIIRPFRIMAFNLMVIVSFVCLGVQALLGALVVLSPAASNRNVWLTANYITYELIAINGFWLFCLIIFVIYLLVRCIRCCCKGGCNRSHLWPSLMNTNRKGNLSKNTNKYVHAIIHGRILIERTLIAPALFSPAYELSRQIHIINAYCRETEKYKDALHDSLWDLLDELIDVHTRVAPQSLYANRVKESVKHTARELELLMPAFIQRLAQREFDLIFTSPMKRRILLKMYIVALFLRGRKSYKDRAAMVQPILTRLKPEISQEPAEYYSRVNPDDSISLGKYSLDDIADELHTDTSEHRTGHMQHIIDYVTINENDSVQSICVPNESLLPYDRPPSSINGEGHASRSNSAANFQDIDRNLTPIPGQVDS